MVDDDDRLTLDTLGMNRKLPAVTINDHGRDPAVFSRNSVNVS
jgi:hypothetical protein